MTVRVRAVLLIALLFGFGAGALPAQVPDTTRERPADPRERGTPADTAVQDTVQAPVITYDPPRFALSVSIGARGSAPLQTQPVLLERRGPEDSVLASATVARHLNAEGGLRVGASVLASVDATWAVRVGGSYGTASLSSDYTGAEGDFLGTAEATEESGDLTSWSVEAALRYRIPSTRRLQPFVELGIETTEWRADTPPAGAEALGDGVRRTAILAAVGALLPLQDWLSARFEAGTRAGRTPLDPAPVGPAGSVEAPRSPLRPPSSKDGQVTTFTFQEPGAAGSGDGAIELLRALRFDLGLTIRFGTVRRPGERSETAASTSPPGR